MNAKTTTEIITQTMQHLPDGRQIPLIFNYPAGFKIGDIINVTTTYEVIQLFENQRKEGLYTFEINVWDDRFKLHCNAIQELKTNVEASAVFSFKIREIELFSNSFSSVKKTALGN